MKCPNCNREYNGKSCPYCDDDYQEIKPKVKLEKFTILFIILTIILVVLSFSWPIFILLAILSLALMNYFVFLKNENFKRPGILLDIVLGLLIVISFLTFITPTWDKAFSYKKIEKDLKIDLPNESAISYEYNSGRRNNNVSYTFYKYEINSIQYENIIGSERFVTRTSNDWFITNVSKLDDGYILYDYLKEGFVRPNDPLKFYYIFVQAIKENNKYYAYIYKVEKRGY